MKSNKKINYIVKTTECKKNNKNLFIAAILAIFLGIIGIHRFYLNRKVSGFTFLMISIFSLNFGSGNLATLIVFISIIEGMVYLFKGIFSFKNKTKNKENMNKKNINTPEMKKIEYSDKDIVKIKEEKIKMGKKEDVNDLEIIDISNIKTKSIPKENDFLNIFKTNWIKILTIPYERSIMKVTQVKEETLKLYEKLCIFLDKELKNNKSSLNKEIKRIESEVLYYDNILYTIYCISEGHVTKVYSGTYDYYDPEYSYKILNEHLGENLKDKLFIKAQEFEKDISPPNRDTLDQFNLTENGLSRKWWDNDGQLRSSRKFSSDELNILNATPARTTIVWDIYGVKEQIITLYLEIWQVISNGLNKNIKWKNKNILKDIVDGKYIYFDDYNNGKILSSLIKIAENTIREFLPGTQILNINNQQNNIKKYLPEEIVDDINTKKIEYTEHINDEKLIEILNCMIEKDPSDWKLKVERILIDETDKRIRFLIDYKEDENFIKIAKEIIKKSDDENLLLLCLYEIEKGQKLSQKNAKVLKNIIHNNNISIYEDIIKSKEELSLELFNRLEELKNPIRKKIELDMGKVELSKKELNKTVEIVKEYIDDEASKEGTKENNLKQETVETKCDDKLEFKHMNFLKLLLDIEFMKIEEAKKIAMENDNLLNAFISDVNQELYEYIQDQTVIIEDDIIKIDDFYVDMVKELILNEQ
ncbi:MAG: NINE protein [Senegalia sp. (in: firmicutes)]|uniref:NINE protein n=2 Tax=Senegalia sp. (in: firmicutes) TaxID=1924098 RepID=UPI003F958EA9